MCDCPGLVFPQLCQHQKPTSSATGVLPIDQLREYTGPAALVARRVPKPFLEAVYGIQIRTRPAEEGGSGIPTSEEFLSAYARHRGFMTQGLGQPDQSRAARYVLKDYVNGKLLYCEPPPGSDIDPKDFNRELYDISHLPPKRRMALAAALDAMNVDDDEDGSLGIGDDPAPTGSKSKRIDKSFFKPGPRNSGHLSMPFNYKYTEQGQALASGKHLSGRKMRTMIALENGIDPKDVQLMSGKKHFKGGQKARGKKGPKNDED